MWREAIRPGRAFALAIMLCLCVARTAAGDVLPAPPAPDSTLVFHLRTFYYDGNQNTGRQNRAWTAGGGLTVRTPWLGNLVAAGATLHGSAPIYAPEDQDGTFLLEPGQDAYAVVGEAYAALRYRDHVVLKAYRQLIDQGYINPSDIRMTPFTFEGLTAGGVVGGVRYLAGYLWAVKQWNADTFVSMAAQAGAAGSDAGVGMVGVQLAPAAGLRVDLSDQYGFDTFNTLYAKADWRRPVQENLTIGVGAEYTDQRAVGDALVGNAETTMWRTRVGGVRLRAITGDLTFTTAATSTAAGHGIQNPWGTYPGFLALIDAPASRGFARANEKGWLVGAVYDFSNAGASGLVGTVNIARGTDAIDPRTSARLPDQTEYNFKVDCPLPWPAWNALRNLRLTVRGAIYDDHGADRLAHQIHVIVNGDWSLLGDE